MNRDTHPLIVRYITAYAVTRHYGGPEEGGWWYDRFTPIETVRLRRLRNIGKIERRLWKRHNHIIEGDINSVLGGTDLYIMKEPTHREFTTRRAPRYE